MHEPQQQKETLTQTAGQQSSENLNPTQNKNLFCF